MIGVRERVGERELRPVRDAPEGDLVVAERLPNRLQVLGVVGGAVVVTLRPERRGARGRERGLSSSAETDVCKGRALEQRRSWPVPRSSYATSV